MSVLTHKEAYVDVSIGARIKAARTAAGMTQMDVARRTDLSLQAVGDIERGIVRDPHISSLRQIAYALGVPVEMLVKEEMAVPAFPLGDASDQEPRRSQDERRLGYLRAWRAFVHKLLHRWEQDPPKSRREIAVVLVAMQALLEEGAFERPPEQITTSDKREISEWLDLSLLFHGIDRLNQMADDVQEMADTVQEMADDAQADAEAERRRAMFREIKGRMAG
jgi:transcriptional regulator with XRE-family HTH domain